VSADRAHPHSTTIKDIAKRTGLSYATVSRALNHKYGVKATTRELVLAAAREMNYRPNAIARGLITRRTRTIGVVIPDLRNPFFPEVAAGIETAAEELGYSVLLGSSDWSGQREDRYLDLLIERRVDGIILAPVSRSAARYPNALPADVPAVYVSSVPEEVTRAYVVIDNERGGYIATEHLLERGYSPVAFVGAQTGSDTGRERRRGYCRALEAAGHACDPALVLLGPFTREGAADLVRGTIAAKRVPRAIFCENDNLAISVIQTLMDAGYRVPDDVAIIGFDDISWAGLHSVELTTIAQPIHEMGRRSFFMLADMIENGGSPDAVVLEPKLVVRKTT
jgi:LacI family transcriptional regulator